MVCLIDVIHIAGLRVDYIEDKICLSLEEKNVGYINTVLQY